MISKKQHGFLAKPSTCTQLLECMSDWSLALNNKISLDIIYIDYSRAFDSVVHDKLLYKLQCYGIHHDLLSWFSAFLADRKQCVVLDGFKSGFSHVRSGIAQGSCLGPLFFILYINDIADLFGSEIERKLFADDVKLYSSINLDLPCNPLHTALENLFQWSNK